MAEAEQLTEMQFRDERMERRRQLRLRDVSLAILQHPDFYESLSSYQPRDQVRASTENGAGVFIEK